MKKILIALSSIILVIAVVFVYLFIDIFPRTPQKIASVISGLSIPKKSEVINFNDE